MQHEADEIERRHWRDARDRLQAATADPAYRREANRMLWEICQVLHEPDAARIHLDAAIRENPLFSRPASGHAPIRRSVLMLAVPGDFQANLPLDRLFDDSTALHTLWIADPAAVLDDPHAHIPAALPVIDCVFIAIAEDARHRTALLAADALAACIDAPVINRGERIARLSRDGTPAVLAGLPDAVVPAHARVAHGAASPMDFPLIIRPLGSHAGQGLQRMASSAELARYYEQNPRAAHFTVAPFVDYRSADGAWRKYRVIFVAGRPHPLHLAIHDDWAVWYYNAAMHGSCDRLAEERRFLDDLPAVLPEPAMRALHALAERVDLDYFGLDCSVLPDGRLLVFEIETGMIVHQRQPEDGSLRDPGAEVRRAVERMIAQRCAVAARTPAHCLAGAS